MTLTAHLPRYPLAFLPTPLHPLDRLSEHLGGPRLWMKRDDQTGLAGGGNKTRKLEFLLGDALAQGAETLLTTGAVQSNHCRQTAAAAAKAGLACHLVLGGAPPVEPNGNYLLDRLLGAEFHWTTRENRLPALAALAHEMQSAGGRPYPITYGGSDPVGAAGYVDAVEELYGQCKEAGVCPDAIVFASSSGGTHAGLVAGARLLGWNVELAGISIDEPEVDLRANVARLATRTTERIGKKMHIEPDDVYANASYLGGGYGVMGDLEREAIALMARYEGILLDPVYTGRAFGGLLDLIRRGRLKDAREIVFWHTGGSAALFAYAGELLA